MAEKMQVTIIGLGLLGASAGLALRRYPEKLRVVGHDRDTTIAGKAKQMGAVDKTDWNLISAVSGADRVLLAVPVGEAHETLKAIAQDLRPGCVILSMTSVNAPVLAWAAELLPPNVHLVGGRPVVIAENLDTAGARADLFEGRTFCLMPDTRTGDTAATLAADLVDALGARPLFMDPYEHDGMTAAVEHLPLILAGALLDSTSSSNVWQDMRKLAGSQFYSSTLITEKPAAAASDSLANRENLIRWIDRMMAALGAWREMLDTADEKALADAFGREHEVREKWLRAQASGDWSQTPAPEVPGTGQIMRGLLGLRGPERKDKKER